MNLPVIKNELKSRLGWVPSVFRDDPFDNLMDNFFKDFNHMFGSERDCCRVDEDDNVIYTLDVPGFNKDNLSVEVADGVLTISGKSEVRAENSYGRSEIMKRYTVGDIESAKASIKDGILTVKLEYPNKEVKVKQIEISDGNSDCECTDEENCECQI